ncbi:MAG: response regulator [Caldimicrobium sp.]|nr:response regulator [Caldimicrobium sp.]MCX7873616.1 response regulator [Caldimicrobium sp.]MDW8094420.1 response regulator [Caldimicrobium sp.]
MILLALSEGIFQKLKKILDAHKIKYQLIESGEELLEKAKKNKVSLIILEKDLPLLDGFAVTLLLKSNPKTAHIPIIALCKCNYPEEEIKAKDSGADFIIYYPFTEEEILNVIREFVKK